MGGSGKSLPSRRLPCPPWGSSSQTLATDPASHLGRIAWPSAVSQHLEQRLCPVGDESGQLIPEQSVAGRLAGPRTLAFPALCHGTAKRPPGRGLKRKRERGTSWSSLKQQWGRGGWASSSSSFGNSRERNSKRIKAHLCLLALRGRAGGS